MADDWQKGNLALCVKLGPWRGEKDGEIKTVHQDVQAGGIYLVRHVGLSELGRVTLWLDGVGDTLAFRHGFHARRFRKITPPPADEFDRETIELMNRAPAKEPTNA